MLPPGLVGRSLESREGELAMNGPFTQTCIGGWGSDVEWTPGVCGEIVTLKWEDRMCWGDFTVSLPDELGSQAVELWLQYHV